MTAVALFPRDEYFMRLALREAERALDHDDVPIGALVVGGGEVIGAACNEPCAVVAGGTISVPGAARVFRLRRATRTLAAGVRARIKVRITMRTRRPLRRALTRRRRVRARVTVRATDPAGNARSVTTTVRARR